MVLQQVSGESNGRTLDSIADALQRPVSRDTALVWIAPKHNDALNTSLLKNKGTVSIDATGRARIIDDAIKSWIRACLAAEAADRVQIAAFYYVLARRESIAIP